jgi:cobalt-zinc-cadmium efflux system protein
MDDRDHHRERGAVRTGLAVSSILCVTELVGGWLTNSLALLSDAAHMFTDVAALGLTLFALWVGGRPASDRKTYGWYRAEILAALVNGVVLWVLTVFLVLEAWRRLGAPEPVAARGMLAIALLGLVVNVFVARRLHEHQDHSLNVRGAYLHVLADLLGSIGALSAAIVILLTGWMAVDALASFVIAALIFVGSWQLVREAVDVLMEAVPSHVDLDALCCRLRDVGDVEEVHDVHVWTLTTGRYALSAHVVSRDHVSHDALLDRLTAVCADVGIDHVTIQIEHESRRSTEPSH